MWAGLGKNVKVRPQIGTFLNITISTSTLGHSHLSCGIGGSFSVDKTGGA
jgi:hypothetical protein